jgi:hypothetical protein
MSDATQNPTTQNVQINLRDMAGRYMGAVQRVFDLAASTIGSLRCQTEKDYDEFASLGRFMPSPQQHANFDTIRPVAEQWLLRLLLSEALGDAGAFPGGLPLGGCARRVEGYGERPGEDPKDTG